MTTSSLKKTEALIKKDTSDLGQKISDDVIDENESGSEEDLKERLLPRWRKESRLNNLTEEVITKNRAYLWSFGENENWALSV